MASPCEFNCIVWSQLGRSQGRSRGVTEWPSPITSRSLLHAFPLLPSCHSSSFCSIFSATRGKDRKYFSLRPGAGRAGECRTESREAGCTVSTGGKQPGCLLQGISSAGGSPTLAREGQWREAEEATLLVTCTVFVKILLAVIMQITKGEGKNESFLGVSG